MTDVTCDLCGEPIDYTAVVWKVDLQEWYLNRATGEKKTLCEPCGHRLQKFLSGEETAS